MSFSPSRWDNQGHMQGLYGLAFTRPRIFYHNRPLGGLPRGATLERVLNNSLIERSCAENEQGLSDPPYILEVGLTKPDVE
jgi:hypothetical protein